MEGAARRPDDEIEVAPVAREVLSKLPRDRGDGRVVPSDVQVAADHACHAFAEEVALGERAAVRNDGGHGTQWGGKLACPVNTAILPLRRQIQHAAHSPPQATSRPSPTPRTQPSASRKA